MMDMKLYCFNDGNGKSPCSMGQWVYIMCKWPCSIDMLNSQRVSSETWVQSRIIGGLGRDFRVHPSWGYIDMCCQQPGDSGLEGHKYHKAIHKFRPEKAPKLIPIWNMFDSLNGVFQHKPTIWGSRISGKRQI